MFQLQKENYEAFARCINRFHCSGGGGAKSELAASSGENHPADTSLVGWWAVLNSKQPTTYFKTVLSLLSTLQGACFSRV
jgi:hypothetical protein